MHTRPATAPLDAADAHAEQQRQLLLDVRAALRAPRWWRAFPARLEARMQADQGPQRQRHLLVAGLVSLLVYDLFLINDALLRPEVLPLAILARLGVTTAYGLGALWLVHHGLSPRWREWLMASTAVVAMAMSSLIFHQTRSPAAQFDPFVFGLVFMGTSVVFPLRLLQSVVIAVPSMAVAAVSIVGHPLMPREAQAFALGLLAATAVFTSLACWRMEQAMRLAYLLMLQEELRSQAAQKLADEYALISQTDALTGLSNRRAFDVALAQRWLAARNRGAGLALLVVDVDHFKRYNDHHGHPAGDACLRRVAQAMAGAVREGDLLARIGGEEFVLLLGDGRVPSATAAAERLRQAVQALGLPHGGVAGDAVVTVSIGVAVRAPQAGAEPADLMAAADQALYLAKQCGRNRWLLADAAAAAPPQAEGSAVPHCAQ